jgi:hypothetical protein
MLYPLSYEGGDAFPQVRPYFVASPDPCPSIPCPWRAQSMDDNGFLNFLSRHGALELSSVKVLSTTSCTYARSPGARLLPRRPCRVDC